MIDDVLEELTAVGKVDSAGEFTVDRAKAREKMRRFQLADPRAYVLELVQAASLKGATWATFEVDSRDMVMELDGRPFTTADFDDIYGAVLTRRLDPDVLARRQLALGLNSAMALRPAFIEVESGDGKIGARLRLSSKGEDAFEAIETTRVGTRIHVRERFTMGTFAAYFKNLAGTLAEEQLLRARCGYASLGIGLEGARLDRGLVLDEGEVLDAITFEAGPTRVVCGLHPDGARSATVRLCKDGVWITDHELPTARFPAGFFAVVQDHDVRKDVSQGDIVRDAAYERMLGVVDRGCRMALAALAERMLAGSAPPWAELELVRQLHGIAISGSVGHVDEPTGLVKVLRRLPLWETTTGRSLALFEILAVAQAEGSVAFTSRSRFETLVPAGRSLVIFLPAPAPKKVQVGAGDKRGRILEHVLGKTLVDATTELEGLVRREHARRAFRARPTAATLPQGAYLCRRTFALPGVRGELGIAAEQTYRASLALVVEGCLLVEHDLALPWLGLRVVVEAEAFAPNDAFVGIELTAEACTALLQAALEIPPLYTELSRLPETAWRDACAMSLLEAMLRGDSLAALVPGASDAPTVRAAVAAFGPERLRLDAGLSTDTPHPLTLVPLLRRLGPRRVALRDVFVRARQGEAIRVVAKDVPGIEADILVLDDDERELLQPLFARPFVDAKAEVTRMLREREFLAKPAGPPKLDRALPSAVLVPIEGKGITGRLQVVPKPGQPTGPRAIAVLHQQRPIDSLQLVLAGECTGWVESSDVAPRADYRGVQDGAALDRMRAAVLRAFAAACLQVAARSRVQPSAADAELLREALALAFPTRPMRMAFDHLADVKGVERRSIVGAYRRIYAAMHVQTEPGKLDDRLTRLSWSKTAVADALAIPAPPRSLEWALAAVDVLLPPGDAPDELFARALRPVAPLDELPLFERHDGRPLTLAEIREAVERKQTLLHIDERVSIDVGDRMMVHVDVPRLDVLLRLVGRRRLIPGSGAIAQARKRQALEARPKVDAIALPPGVALVSTSLRPAKGQAWVEGEVGLRSEHPGDPTRRPVARLSTYQRRAELGVVELPDQPAWIVAAVDDHRLSLSADHKSVERNSTFDALVERCRGCVPALVLELVSRWSQLGPTVRVVAWYHLLDFLVAHPPATLEAWRNTRSSSSVPEAFAAAAAVPGFIGAGGVPLSALQLAQAHLRHGRLEVLPPPFRMWGDSPLPQDRPVACVDPYELAALRTLLPQVEDVSEEWPQWQERALNRASAPAARTLCEAETLVVQEIAMQDLEGRLAIPVAGVPLSIELCAEGKVLTSRSLPGVLPCWGSVSGAMIVPDERFTDAVVGDELLAALRLRSLKLYDKLARWMSANEDHPEHARVVSMLSDVVVLLRRSERAGSLPEPYTRLLHDLRSARVLRLSNGRRISLHKALEEQPGELAHLDLWDAPGVRLQQRYAEAAALASTWPGPESGPLPVPTPAPQAAPAPAPTPPPPPVPTPEERLADALRAELGLVRTHNERLLANVQLDRIRVRPLTDSARQLVARADAGGVIVNRDHPVVQRALVGQGTDPVWCSYVASAVYTALNVWLSEITDADERKFLELFAGLVAGH